jgi:proteic killer suppression protein
MDTDSEKQWQDLCRRWSDEGYASLSRTEQTWLNIRALIDSTQNGGLISYFYNSGAGTLSDCLEDLKVLEATAVSAQVERVCELFPGGVPTELEARNEIINSWPDGDEMIEALLYDIPTIALDTITAWRYYCFMIKSFADKETENIFDRKLSKKLPQNIQRNARLKLELLDAANLLQDLSIPPGNKLEKLSGNREGQYSIRINDQWRICFFWRSSDAYEVEIVDYHQG